MELKKAKKNPAKIISLVALAVIIVAAAGYGSYAFMAKTWPFATQKPATANDATSKPFTDATSDSSTSKPPSASDQDKTPTQSTPPSDDSNTSSGNSSSDNNGITGSINYASATDDTLKVRVTITELLNSGTCTLTLSNATTGSSTTYKADIIANPSSSTCDGFNIPTKNLAKGDYNISVHLSSGDKSGVASSKVTI